MLKRTLMDLIKAYFPNLKKTQLEQFSKLGTLYREWNSKINVISRKDIDALYEKHILHSLAIAKVQTFVPDSHILDVGTGGGFPGLPLAILLPESKFHLVDSINKKLKVVQAISENIKLNNIKTSHCRAEHIDGGYDFIVSRAVTQMPEFVTWVKGKVKKKQNHQLKNGILYLKGGDLSKELKKFTTAKEFPISDFFKESFFETKKVVHLPLKY